MNEELQKALAEFVRATLAGFKTGKDFVVAEAPDVIQQLIRWNFWSHVFWAVVFTVVALAVWRLAVVRMMQIRAAKDQAYDRDNYTAGAVACGGVVGIFSCLALYNTQEALQIYIAPKVWLIEWAMEMLKTQR